MVKSSGVIRILSFVSAWRWLLSALLLLALGGCVPVGNGLQALHGRWYREAAGKHDTLWVLLPGRYDTASAFANHAWIVRARAAGVHGDFEAVDAYLDYYIKRTIVPRLHQDVILPARKAGYRHIVLVGVSMGATGALVYWLHHPSEINGLVLFSPFLGNKPLLDGIREAGGVRLWHPATCPPANFCRLWKSLKRRDATGGMPGSLLLLFGRQDRLHEGHKLLASLLPKQQVLSIDGGHNWTTWGKLYGLALRRGLLQRMALQDRKRNTAHANHR